VPQLELNLRYLGCLNILDLIPTAYLWKTGVVFTNGSARAEVTELYTKRELRLRVSGSDQKRWLSAVTHEINKIHASYQSSDNPRDTRLRYQTLIPCNCDTCKGSQRPHDYPYDRLQKFIRDGQYQIQCQESYTMVDVRSLLDDVLNSPPEPLEIQISNAIEKYLPAEIEFIQDDNTEISKNNKKSFIGRIRDTLFGK
jgi:internalin A